MSNRLLTFIPSGGLANRMRAIASAVNLSQHTGIDVEIVWFRDWGLNAKFKDIFEPVSCAGVSLREANMIDALTIDRPRNKNLYIPSLYQFLFYDRRIHERQITPLKQNDFDFDGWAKEGRHHYMSCYQVFGNYEDYDSLIRRLFIPAGEIRSKVEEYTCQFTSHTIGLHIRRTDNSESIEKSPTKGFINVVDREIAANSDTIAYLATDDESIKHEFHKRYGNRIITPDQPASRGSLEGIRDGIVDMWTLAATDVIYGSQGSSFSPMASTIGGNRLVMV